MIARAPTVIGAGPLRRPDIPGGRHYRVPMRSFRDVIAVVLLLAATVLGATWLPAVWVERNLVDQEGFLEITQPLADDPDFRADLADDAVDALLDHDAIPDWIAERIDPIAREQATRFTGTDLYATLWERTMIEVHESLFASGTRDVVVDLAPAVDSIITAVEDIVPIVDLESPETVPVTVATIPDLTILEKANLLDPWAGRLGWIALGCALLGIVVAAHRRTTLLAAGIGTLVAGAADWILSRRIEEIVPDSADQAAFLGPLLQVFEDRFTAEIGEQALILGGAGAGVIVTAILLLAAGPSRSRRTPGELSDES